MEFRALFAGEFDAWLDHVTSVFGGSRQYFYNHWHNDTWQDLEGIRVAVDDRKIVSTVRVFLRKMYFHGEPISVGGIGEVSTRKEYRQRGIATQLLRDSIKFMESRQIALSMLHGNQRIYSAEGWQRVLRYVAKKTVVGKVQQKWDIRPVNFKDVDEVQQITSIYDSYCCKFNGPFVRDDFSYWTDWVQTESPDAWIAVRDDVIAGYISIRKQNNELVINEFVAAEDIYNQDISTELFDSMLSGIIAQMDEEKLEIKFPAPIVDGFNETLINPIRSTMYRVICPDAFPESVRHQLTDSLPELIHNQTETLTQNIQSHHVFWYTDGF